MGGRNEDGGVKQHRANFFMSQNRKKSCYSVKDGPSNRGVPQMSNEGGVISGMEGRSRKVVR